MPDDPKPELYRIMNEAGLVASNLLATQKPMAKIVQKIRLELADKLAEAIVADRESRRPPKKINVKVKE